MVCKSSQCWGLAGGPGVLCCRTPRSFRRLVIQPMFSYMSLRRTMCMISPAFFSWCLSLNLLSKALFVEARNEFVFSYWFRGEKPLLVVVCHGSLALNWVVFLYCRRFIPNEISSLVSLLPPLIKWLYSEELPMKSMSVLVGAFPDYLLFLRPCTFLNSERVA